MKCDNCGKNEASFYYRVSVNGQAAERRLCADCARQEGWSTAPDLRGRDWTDELFGDFFGGSDPFFGGSDPLFGALPFGGFSRLARVMQAPPRTLPRAERGETEVRRRGPVQSEAEAGIPEDAGAEIRKRRETQALREQLAAAVAREDYEQAIRLRDKLRGMDV